MKSIVFCLAVLLAGAAFVHANQSWNDFIDKMLGGILGNKDFDPMHIPDQTQEINKKKGLIHLHGIVELHNTTIVGLSKIHRNGDAQVTSKDGVLDAKLRIKDEHVKFYSRVHIEVGHRIHKNLVAEVFVGDIDIKFQAAIGGAAGIKLEQFEIDELQQVRVMIHGFGPADPAIDLAADAFLTVFNRKARHLITNVVRPIIEDQIKHIHF